MKAMGKITLTLGLMIIVSLFLTSCSGVITPEITMGNTGNPSSNNPNSNNYQGSSTDPVEEQATEEQTISPSSNNPNSNNYQGSSTDPVEEPITEESGTVEVDTTKPVITGSLNPLPNSLGWNNTDVTVSFSCADIGSVQSGIDINTVAGETVTTEGKDQSVTNTGVCIDAAGNTADPVTVSNINIDKTPPIVMLTLPGTGEYVLNQSITATWSATDTLSGVVSPVSGSVSIDTSSVGTKSFTLPVGTAKDKAGNSSLKVTKSYTIIENTEERVMWSGLGMGMYCSQVSYVDTLLANGFTELRIDIPDYENTAWLANSKAALPGIIAKGANVIWGVSTGTTLTSSNWAAYVTAVESAAAWAQANGVFEFQLGNELENRNDNTTLTDAQLINNLKSLASDVKTIFTNGNVSYSCYNNNIDDWVAVGKGDLDILASNIYIEWEVGEVEPWKYWIDALVGAFGADGTYLTEFALSSAGLSSYDENEAVQAAAVTEMIEYIKTSGMTRALFYCLKDDGAFDFGAITNDGTYRLLWNQALLNSESIKFATVPTKTTIASLPDAITTFTKNNKIAQHYTRITL